MAIIGTDLGTSNSAAAFLLQKIKRNARAFLGEAVTQAVVIVPACFEDNQRNATNEVQLRALTGKTRRHFRE